VGVSEMFVIVSVESSVIDGGGGKQPAWEVRVRWGYALSRLNKGGVLR
jgi:hypothetical protein